MGTIENGAIFQVNPGPSSLWISCECHQDRGLRLQCFVCSIFTVHGLWPDNGDGSYPRYCKPEEKFNPAFVQDMLDTMRLEWPSYYGSDNGFWAHEWEKHGTCSAPYLKDEEEYFSTILKLKEEYDLLVKPWHCTSFKALVELLLKSFCLVMPNINDSWNPM